MLTEYELRVLAELERQFPPARRGLRGAVQAIRTAVAASAALLVAAGAAVLASAAAIGLIAVVGFVL